MRRLPWALSPNPACSAQREVFLLCGQNTSPRTRDTRESQDEQIAPIACPSVHGWSCHRTEWALVAGWRTPAVYPFMSCASSHATKKIPESPSEKGDRTPRDSPTPQPGEKASTKMIRGQIKCLRRQSHPASCKKDKLV